jgi:hypothetical protein
MSFALNAWKRSFSAARTEYRGLVLLAPRRSAIPGTFSHGKFDRDGYEQLLAEMQRFRGATYLKDDAISAQDLDDSGRHRLDMDTQSWHVLSLDDDGHVCGCSRLTGWNKNVEFHNLGVGKSALAQSDSWGPKLRMAVEKEMQIAAFSDLTFSEVGGWAIAEKLRSTTEALRIALATYALGQVLGGVIGLTTATVRHSSANVLRKIGGCSLVSDATELPKYFDPQYGCEMEILRFNSNEPNPRFAPWIQQIRSELLSVPVLTAGPNPQQALSGSYEDMRIQQLPLAWQFS